MHVLLYGVTIHRHTLMFLYFKVELIGYWLAQQLITVRDVQVMCCICTGWTFVQCTMCVMLCGVKRGQTGSNGVKRGQTRSKLRSCYWPSLKMNRPHLTYMTFHWNSNGKIKKHIRFRLQKDQGCCLSSNVRGRNAQPYPWLSYWTRCIVYVSGAMGNGERVRHRLWGTCNNRTMVPHKEIQWNNGTPQEKFYSLATFGHKREDNQVPHKCHVYGVCASVCVCWISWASNRYGPGRAGPGMGISVHYENSLESRLGSESQKLEIKPDFTKRLWMLLLGVTYSPNQSYSND